MIVKLISLCVYPESKERERVSFLKASFLLRCEIYVHLHVFSLSFSRLYDIWRACLLYTLCYSFLYGYIKVMVGSNLYWAKVFVRFLVWRDLIEVFCVVFFVLLFWYFSICLQFLFMTSYCNYFRVFWCLFTWFLW